MTDQLPSKEEKLPDWRAVLKRGRRINEAVDQIRAEYGVFQSAVKIVNLEDEIERLQQDLARTESAHAVVMAENRHYKQRVAELERENAMRFGQARHFAELSAGRIAHGTRVCQHDKTKPGPTLVPLGSAAHSSSDWLWRCTVCDYSVRMPIGEAHGAPSTTGDGSGT